METSTILALLAVIIIAALISVIFILMRKSKNANADETASTQMKLQAYERMILLVNRIALPNLISRESKAGVSAREMQLLLTQAIRQEFEHNITQQIYISADAWTAVKNLKEQNMLIINQFANVLPPNANGLDLNKLLLEFLMNDKKGSLHEVVSEVLSYEAKKIL